MKKIAVIGGGAAGFFTAINAKINHPEYEISIFEKSNKLLSKVKVSGGGRCNVTHACFEPRELVKFYPRGNKELRGPFHKFMTGDTMEWFESRGVALKIEEDNRVFPVSDSSQSIIDCLLNETRSLGIGIFKKMGMESLSKQDEKWKVGFSDQSSDEFDAVVICCGSSKSAWSICEELGHNIIEPIPSLFTFNIDDPLIKDIPGLSVAHGETKVLKTKFKENGPLLITHWGMSGPGILKLSAVAARDLHEKDYQFQLMVDWAFEYDEDEVRSKLIGYKESRPKHPVGGIKEFDLPKRLWHGMLQGLDINLTKPCGELSKKEINRIVECVKRKVFEVNGKSTNKAEFVSCGGVDLKEVDFSKFASKLHSGLFFGGEILNIDALTGGFNFQAAWTAGHVIANSL